MRDSAGPTDARRDRPDRAVRVALWLAWTELRRSALPGTAPDGRDFQVLIFFLILLSLFVSLLLSLQAGLLDRVADSLMGKVETAGYPIVITAALHTPYKVDRAIVEAFTAEGPPQGDITVPPTLRVPDLELHPFRILYGSEGTLGFGRSDRDPDAPPAWQATQGGSATPFNGWAVRRAHDPLWAWAMEHASAPSGKAVGLFPDAPPIVLNVALFESFDYAAYRAGLAKDLPAPLVALTAPASADGVRPRDLDILWLRANVGVGPKPLVPFRAHWIPNIPAAEPITYLVPAGLMAAFQRSGIWPGFRLFPEHGSGEGRRVSLLQVFPAPGRAQEAAKAAEALDACLGGGDARQPGALPRWRFEDPLPLAIVTFCVTKAGLPDMETPAPPGGPVQAVRAETVASVPYTVTSDDHLVIPCDAVGTDGRERLDGCGMSDHGAGRYDFLTGFNGATVYVPRRDRIPETRDALLGVRRDETQVFWIAPSYDRALDRFHFIESVLSAARLPLVGVGFVFALFLTAFFLTVVISHRRRTYGLMLAQGFGARTVLFAVATQVLVAALIAVPAGFLLAGLLRGGFSWIGWDADVQHLARETLGLHGVDILPPPDPLTLVVAGLAILASSLLLLGGTLLLLPLRHRTEPTDLLK